MRRHHSQADRFDATLLRDRAAWDILPCAYHAVRENIPSGIPQLRAPPWSRHGWTKDSPGFLFYFQPHHAHGPRLLHGEDTHRTVGAEADGATAAKAVHCFAHRSVYSAVAPWRRGI